MAVIGAAMLLAISGVAVKMIFFPSVKDAWFQTNRQKLKQVPAGLVVVRATHFPKSPTNGMAFTFADDKGNLWFVGRNVTFRQLMAGAYNSNPCRVVLPSSAPKNNFDYLVTMPERPEAQEHLRLAVQKKIDYTAHREMCDEDVLALKVQDPALPGLKVSDADEKPSIAVSNTKITFTHQQLGVLTSPKADFLEGFLQTPVVDRTGVKGFYDFSLVDSQKNLNRDDVDKILNGWGLMLESGTASIEMLVVEKAR